MNNLLYPTPIARVVSYLLLFLLFALLLALDSYGRPTIIDWLVTEDNIETFRSKQLRLEPFFQKDPKFQDEQEFRFLWLLNLGSMEKDDFDLTTTSLRTIDLKNLAAPISGKPCSLSGIYNRRGVRIV